MTYVYETEWSGSEILAEYCYSSLNNCIKVVELKVDGKFHRMNWMAPNGRDKLMAELMSDYDGIMLGQQDPDYDSEIDLDRDVPDGEIEVDSSDKPVVVDYLEEIMWLDSDTSCEATPVDELDHLVSIGAA